MEIINVFIIIGKGYTTQKVINEIRDEGYKHNFFFSENQSLEYLKDKMNFSDECWYFGKVIGDEIYEYAKSIGMDIWNMTV